MSFLRLTSPGLALWSIPAAFALAYVPNTFNYFLIGRSIGYDNVQPRDNIARLERDPDPSVNRLAPRAKRMEGAHKNGYETLTLWSSAVIAATFAGLDPIVVNCSSGIFLFTRVLYNYLYITQTTELEAAYRSVVFYAGLTAPVFLLIKAGRALTPSR